MTAEAAYAVNEGNSGLFKGLSKIHSALNRVGRFSWWLDAIGLVIFFMMMLLTFVDVILRYIFNAPIMGVKEFTEVLLVMLISFTISYTHEKKGHITMGIVTDKLSDHANLLLSVMVNIISMGIFIIVAWQNADQLIFDINQGAMHGTALYIPSWPFQATLVIGTITLTLLIIRDFVGGIMECLKSRIRPLTWFMIFAIPAVIIGLSFFWMQPKLWPMDLPLVGLIGVLVMLFFMTAGMPTSFSLLLSGFLMIGHIRGTATAFDVIGTEMFGTASDYVWSVVCFFILMGFLCLYAKLGEDIYITFYKWIGHLRGGLAFATIFASTAMAGIVGDMLSVASTMGTIAYPQMKKYGYKDILSIGTIAAGSTIGPLIPPSMGFIIYGVLTGQSIGRLFIAGIIPGVVLATTFILNIAIRCTIDPKLAPAGPVSSWKERMVSLKYGGPIVFLFLLIIGGIYAGIFTAIEGGAMGCVGALAIGLIMKRFTRYNFFNSLIEAGKLIGMIFVIIIGATIFSRFVAWCNLSGFLLGAVTGLNLDGKTLVAAILAFYFFVGFAVDILPLMLIMVPIFHPIVTSMGIDGTWFTVMSVISIQAGEITPPLSTMLFALKGIIPGSNINTIFNAAWFFVISTALCIILLFFFPDLVTWLPNIMYGK
jgi:tripartite ATP-independent transporter DctM subunit